MTVTAHTTPGPGAPETDADQWMASSDDTPEPAIDADRDASGAGTSISAGASAIGSAERMAPMAEPVTSTTQIGSGGKP